MKCFSISTQLASVSKGIGNHFLKSSAIVLALIQIGCGGEPLIARSNRAPASAGSSTSGSTSAGDAVGSVPLDAISGAATSSSASSHRTGVAPLIKNISGTGYTSVSLSVSTRSVLKVRFSPGKQQILMVGATTPLEYANLGVYISVGDNSQPTPFLSNGLLTSAADSSPIMNFSANIPGACGGSDTSCRENVTVTVAQPNYDFYHLNFGDPRPWMHVQDGHGWNGRLQIETDDTDAIL